MERLGKLFGSPARLKILRLFLFNQDKGFTLPAIAERTKLSREAVRGELADLISAGVVGKKGERTNTRYHTNSRYEHLPALERFIRDTTAINPTALVTALKKTGVLKVVVLTGLFTGAIESQVDLLIAGDSLDARALARAVRAIEAELGREIRYTAFETGDFRYRLGVYDRLVRDVFDYPHRLLVDRIGL